MTVEELDLARAKDLAWQELVDTFAGEVTGRGWTMETFWNSLHPNRQDQFISMARAIRLGDEARGLRVVPVDTLEGIASWLERWAPHVEGCNSIRQCTCGLQAIRAEARLAASPFAPEDGT